MIVLGVSKLVVCARVRMYWSRQPPRHEPKPATALKMAWCQSLLRVGPLFLVYRHGSRFEGAASPAQCPLLIIFHPVGQSLPVCLLIRPTLSRNIGTNTVRRHRWSRELEAHLHTLSVVTGIPVRKSPWHTVGNASVATPAGAALREAT